MSQGDDLTPSPLALLLGEVSHIKPMRQILHPRLGTGS